MEQNTIKRLTGVAIINRAEGKRVAYTYSEVDENTGDIIQDNIKQSFIALDDEFLKAIKAVEDYVKEYKLKE
ncbi:hypothetical protein [Clostridium sporogenes]|uniref:hypothetical protein n=1 Tax=Clostridium sporogenes TaxID=1509 RepID=UPI0013D06F08|nr:hypothetical protein [Clostridium sporogenes]NFP92421.1 hypothetical protein [Clostridium sporogenes]